MEGGIWDLMKSVWRALPVDRSRSEMQDFRRWPKRSRVDVDVDDDTAFIYLCKNETTEY